MPHTLKLIPSRQKAPRERYTLKPHEVRKLVAMARRIGRPVNGSDLKVLQAAFGGTSLKSLVEALAKNGVPIMDQISGENRKTSAPAKPKRKTLGIATPKTEDAPSAPPSAPATTPEDDRAIRSELAVLQSKLARQEVDLKNRERDLTRLQALATQDREDAQLATEAADRLAGQLQAKIDRLRAAGEPLPRDPDAEPVRLYNEGAVRQAILARDLAWSGEVADRDALIARLRAELTDARGFDDRQPECQVVPDSMRLI
ncbi:hypothetical protein LCM08_06320 [Salipiger pacificus]|nr:hypothetical protein [Alloyangia pacifica]